MVIESSEFIDDFSSRQVSEDEDQVQANNNKDS